MSSRLNVGTSLIGRARANLDDWPRLVRACAPLIYADCRRFGLPPTDASDVAQEVFLAVHQSLPRLIARDSKGFRGWLASITRNKVRDFYRKLNVTTVAAGGTRAQQRLHQYCAAEAANEATGGPAASLVHRALLIIEEDFEPKTWRAFWRTAVDECSAADTAHELGMSAAAVRKAKSRVLARLRDELHRLEGADLVGDGKQTNDC